MLTIYKVQSLTLSYNLSKQTCEIGKIENNYSHLKDKKTQAPQNWIMSCRLVGGINEHDVFSNCSSSCTKGGLHMALTL